MRLTLPAAPDRDTVLRYWGAAGWQPDEAADALLARAQALVQSEAAPRGVWRALPLSAPEKQGAVLAAQSAGSAAQQGGGAESFDFVPFGMDIGADLTRHLRCCTGVIFMAVTLGARIDALLRRLEVTDIALAAAADATASALTEQTADTQEALIRAQLPAGQYMTGRFAPGYGDCPLALNDTICLALDTVRGIGMAVTDEHLLTPRKSTTAVLGLSDRPVTGARAGCELCALRTICAYRKRGTTCG